MKNHLLWVEKYRPTTIKDCILPSNLQSTFDDLVKQGKVTNLLLSGSAGIGKTTVAKALCNETDSDYMIINASESGNIDTLRTTIKQYASTVSLDGNRKVVILDEADYLNAQSTQPALRGFMEEYSRNTSFVLTANFKNKIIEPLHSRCAVVDFKIPANERPQIAAKILSRIKFILKSESVSADEAVLVGLVKKHFPDFRRIINELQRHTKDGKIDASVLNVIDEVKLSELMKFMKAKDFTNVRKWVLQHNDFDATQIFRSIYDNLYGALKKETIPQAVIILADYQFKSAFVADPEINMLACLTQIMVECEFA